MSARSSFEIAWVERDSSTEHSVDPLGLSAVADALAAQLLPGLTVATSRARYYSFLCWAVKQAEAKSRPIPHIHRLEATLALEEASRHGDQGSKDCPSVVGRQTAARYLSTHDGNWPPSPERLYKATAFATYRPSMRALGLLSNSRRPTLTEDGKKLAVLFLRHCGRAPRCLSEISVAEQSAIIRRLGLRETQFRTATMGRRYATYRELRALLSRGHDAASILEHYVARPADHRTAATLLHKACAWETLSIGLTLAFSLLVQLEAISQTAHQIAKAMAGRPRWQGFVAQDADQTELASAVVSNLRKAVALDIPSLGLDHIPVRLAEILVNDRRPKEFLRALVKLHERVKPDEPWVRLDKAANRVRPVASGTRKLDFRAEVRTYRIDAFRQLLTDAGLVI